MPSVVLDAIQDDDCPRLFRVLQAEPHLANVPLDGITPFPTPPLILAIGQQKHCVMRTLIRHGKLNVNVKVTVAPELHCTPLDIVLESGDAVATEFLLENGADIALVGEDVQFTPLHLAAAKMKSPIVWKQLLELCPDKLEQLTPAGDSALTLAIRAQNWEAAVLLFEAGATLSSDQRDQLLDWRRLREAQRLHCKKAALSIAVEHTPAHIWNNVADLDVDRVRTYLGSELADRRDPRLAIRRYVHLLQREIQLAERREAAWHDCTLWRQKNESLDMWLNLFGSYSKYDKLRAAEQYISGRIVEPAAESGLLNKLRLAYKP